MAGAARLHRGTVVTMDPARKVIDHGAVAVSDDRIIGVGEFDQLRSAWPDAQVVGSPTDLITPGFINAHQHLTGDRLIQSVIPDDLAPGESIFSWVVPVHAEHSGDDDELSATLTLAEGLTNGITSTWEAGTVAHPERVAMAAQRVGARVTLGTWGWDVEDGPFAGSVDDVLARQRRLLDLDGGPLVDSWVSLVGHDLMSDELVVAATALARQAGNRMTFHLSPTTSDVQSYLGRTGKRPVEHLHDLGVLGEHLTIAHAVHLDDREVELLVETQTSVASCPWAYLRLGQGISQQFRHLDLWQRGGRLALGCDAENAGDMVDGLRAASLFAGLAKDVGADPTVFGAHDALELLTIRGAEAMGVADRLGSLEQGKMADFVVFDRTGLHWVPNSPDPVLQLVWGTDGRSVRDVVVGGVQVVADGEVTGIDVGELAAHAAEAGRRLMERASVRPAPRWPPT